MARWDLWESSTLPEEPVGEYDVWIHKTCWDHGERRAFARQVQGVFNLGNHFLVLLVINFLCLLLSWRPPSHGQVAYESYIVVDVIVATSKEFRVGEHWVLGATKECESRTVLVWEIVLGDRRYFIPVTILIFLLVAHLALPPVIAAEGGRHL